MSKTPHPKINVGVIFGGRSGEHEVSLRSARSVIEALDKTKYKVHPIGITKSGHWLAGESLKALSAPDESVVEQSDRNAAIILPPTPSNGELVSDSGPSLSKVDVILPVLHGTFGEDGTIQGLLELADIPYVGSGVVGSAVGMDKAIFKQVMAANHLAILPWELIQSSKVRADAEGVAHYLETQLFYPMFVKPANLGSSVGITKCSNHAELIAGLHEASRFDRRLVVEQGANIRELEISVLGNDNPIASIVGEIRPKRDFYDYDAKYITDDSELLIPAPLDEALANQAREMAIAVFKAVDAAGLSRVDLMLDRESGDLYVNEINTMPGFTSISMYPKLWEATGISYPDLLDRLITLALERHAEKQDLVRDFTQ
ncbi:MAG: D-alanine--D-alanine ligase family protein [Chloroflexota bacterium]